jgi:cobalt transporter subunit CbtB
MSTTIQPRTTTIDGDIHSEARALTACAVAFVFGLALMFTVGFSHMDVFHNAAHDTRHSLAFPCH